MTTGTLICLVILVIVQVSWVVAPPVNPQKPQGNAVDDDDPEGIFTLEYARYLREVVETLEEDPDFKKKLQNASEDEIKSGRIARHLEFVNHGVRSKLDEIKRSEVQRIRRLVREHDESLQGVDRSQAKIPRHFDHRNPHSFEMKDLENLIFQATKDINEADKRRKSEFKEYEMEKERLRQEQLHAMDEAHRKKAEEEHEAELKKHKEHPKLHHPGTKEQFEEVWEKEDQLPVEDFNPKTFFRMHDMNGDGYLDNDEIKALFVTELNKMYDSNATEDDMNEKMEEMERMREHVFKEGDVNKDGMISFKEFMDYTTRKEYNEDPGWHSLDEEPQFTKEEYEAYERERQEEMKRMAAAGINPWGGPPPMYPHGGVPPGPMYDQGPHHMPQQGYPQQGYQQGMHDQYQQQPQQHFQQPSPAQHHQMQQQQQYQPPPPVHQQQFQPPPVQQQPPPVQQQQQHNVPVQQPPQPQQNVPVQQQQQQQNIPVSQQQPNVPVQPVVQVPQVTTSR